MAGAVEIDRCFELGLIRETVLGLEFCCMGSILSTSNIR